MSDWQPIESAPKNAVVIGYWHVPVFMFYLETPDKVESSMVGKWPFRRKETIIRREHGWRVVTMGREFDFFIHGNYGPFEPTHWMPLPAPPDDD